jgi:hypothetical protein
MAPDIKISNNSEIDQALKEFEMKSQAEQARKPPEALGTSEVQTKEVEGVKFETDSYKAVKFYNETAPPKMVKLVIKYSGGAVKEQRQAEYILFGFVVLATIISLFLFFTTGRTQPKSQKPPAAVLEQMRPIPVNH